MAATLAAHRVAPGALKALVPWPHSRSISIFKSSASNFHLQSRLRPKAQYNQFTVGETSTREQVTLGDYKVCCESHAVFHFTPHPVAILHIKSIKETKKTP